MTRMLGVREGSRSRTTAAGCLLFGLAFLATLTSCGGAGDSGASDAPGLRLDDPKVSKFLQDCESGVNEWIGGQVNYPRTLAVRMGESRSYRATIDIRTDPQTPDGTQLTDEATGEPVAVQCVVGARLAPVGDALDAEPRDWVAREFTPVGTVSWVWSITSDSPGDHQVGLMLHPALATRDGRVIPTESDPMTATFVTDVTVEATAVQRVVQWIDENLTTVIVTVGGLVVIALMWAGKIVAAWRDFIARLRGAPTPNGDEPNLAEPPDESRPSDTKQAD